MRGGGAGRWLQSAPETSEREISADVPGKRGKGKGVKIEKKRRKIILKGPGGGVLDSSLAWTGVCRPDLGTLTHV